MIRRNMVFIEQPFKSRAAVIDFIATAAENAGMLNSKDKFIEAVFRREEEISTSIGHGIAIPHGKTNEVKEAFISYVGLKESFEWDADTKDQVKAVFLIGVPKENANKIHLKIISEVSKKLVNDEFRKKLFACQTAKEAFELLDVINKEIR